MHLRVSPQRFTVGSLDLKGVLLESSAGLRMEVSAWINTAQGKVRKQGEGQLQGKREDEVDL